MEVGETVGRVDVNIDTKLDFLLIKESENSDRKQNDDGFMKSVRGFECGFKQM